MAAILFYYVVGDLTIGKPRLTEFLETSSVGEAMAALQDFHFSELPVWKASLPPPSGDAETISSEQRKSNMEIMQDRFVGMIDMVDIIAHMSSPESLKDPEAGLLMPVSNIIIPDSSLLKQVAPVTRLIDVLELMKQGARQLLVPLVTRTNWRNAMSKKFSMMYYAKWIKSIEATLEEEGGNRVQELQRQQEQHQQQRQQQQAGCCLLSCEDIVRFLLGCMGALAPIPLMTIEALGAVNKIENVAILDANAPARSILTLRRKPATDNTSQQQQGRSAQTVAIVKQREDGDGLCIVGEISAFKLKHCTYIVDAARVFSEASALDFILYLSDRRPGDFSLNLHQDSFKRPERIMHTPKTNSVQTHETASQEKGTNKAQFTSIDDTPAAGASFNKPSARAKKFSSKSCEPLNHSLYASGLAHNQYHFYHNRNRSSVSHSGRAARGWMKPMTCKADGSLAAVMAQLLTYSASDIWAVDDSNDEDDEQHRLVGLVSYAEIISALSLSPNSFADCT